MTTRTQDRVWIFRIVLSILCLFPARIVAGWLGNMYVYHVRPGFNEGTPITVAAVLIGFAGSYVVFWILGNVLIRRVTT
jgi:hypothetical protein